MSAFLHYSGVNENEKEEKIAQACKNNDARPMTVSDTNANACYYDFARLGIDIAVALNAEVLALADAGCTNIQSDEPLFARRR